MSKEIRLVVDTKSLDDIQINLMAIIKELRQFMDNQRSLDSTVKELFETLDDSLTRAIKQICREETKKAFEKEFLKFLTKLKE